MTDPKDELLNLLLTSNIGDWEIGVHSAIHKKSGLHFWIYNGFFGFSATSPSVNPRLGFFRMWELWQFVKNIPAKQLVNKLRHD
jgi:hypothetical protein